MLTEEKIAELKNLHGQKLTAIECGDAVLVFKPPSRAAYDRFVDKKFSAPETISAAARELAQSCLVHPSRDDMVKLLDAYPSLLLNEVCDALLEMSNAGASVKKL